MFVMPTPPKLAQLCLRVLGKQPGHIYTLDECDLQVTVMLLFAVLKHDKLNETVAKQFYNAGHEEVQKWLKENLAWPYNEMLERM